MKTIHLNEFDFGAPAAERDISRGLVDYFVEMDAYGRVRSGERSIILGNRGTGKSAIFKVLAEQERNAGALVIELAPEDYSYELMSQVLASESEGSWAKLGAYAAAWKYIIQVQVMKGLSDKIAGFSRGDTKPIHAYLRDHHSGQQDRPIDKLVSYLKRIEGVKIGSFEASIRTRELQRLYKLEDLAQLQDPLRRCLDRQRVYVIVDELDRGWDASEDARSFVAGLFQACVSLNDSFPGLRVLMSLRRELYDSIPELYEDAQKYRDIIEVLDWDEASLQRLISNRIRYSVPALRDADDASAWSSFLAETLEYRQTKSFNYVVDRTLYRPREIILFCTHCKDSAAKLRAATPLTYDTVSEAELAYTAERMQDIAAEYRFQYPGLLSVFEAFRGRNYAMDREELEDIALEMALGDIGVGEANGWIRDLEPEKIIEVLWRIGFLRAQAVGGVKARRRSGSSYLGPHQVSNLNLLTLSRFQIHPMFRSCLGLREKKG